MNTPSVVRRLRNPEYTGENRCLPCTTVNVVIAVAVSIPIALLSPVASGVFLLFAGAMIFFQGYLVPGTPTLTKRYFPDRALAMFDKHPGPAQQDPGPAQSDPETAQPVSIQNADEPLEGPEELLEAAGAIEECAEEDDLCLTDSFATAWNDRIETVRADPKDVAAVARMLDEDPDSLSFKPGPGNPAIAGNGRVRNWPSTGALVADIAADQELETRIREWDELQVQQRLSLLEVFRSFLERCPLCDGQIVMGDETIESCCRSFEIIAIACTDCDERLLEIDPESGQTTHSGGQRNRGLTR